METGVLEMRKIGAEPAGDRPAVALQLRVLGRTLHVFYEQAPCETLRQRPERMRTGTRMDVEGF